MIDQLITAIQRTKNPSVIGIDTDFHYLPESHLSGCKTIEEVCSAVLNFNRNIIDAIYDIAPAVKVQVAYYEMLGVPGMDVFSKTLQYAKQKGLITIADVKRNDIGATSDAYAKAYFSGVQIANQQHIGFESDFITINGYLGSDGIMPFVKDFDPLNKGAFVLVKTSNRSSGEFQDLLLQDGCSVYHKMAQLVSDWGKNCIGAYGYSPLGAVVGATYPKQAEELRNLYKEMFFLVPGYGAQGGKAEDLTVFFDQNCLGAIVNSSRGILCAYQKEKYKGMDYIQAARQATIDMRDDIVQALNRSGKFFKDGVTK